MYITINSDGDIKEFIKTYIKDNIMLELNYVYKAPGYRSDINIGKFEGELFLEMIVNRMGFQLKWNLPVDIFFEELIKFEFTETGSEDICKFLKYPVNFSIKKENLLLEKLLNLAYDNNFCNKYGLR